VRVLGNVIWFVLAGFWLWLVYVLAGILACILIITIPFGIAAFRIAGFVVWPFGRTTIAKPTAGVGTFIGNIVWLILLGWELALAHLVTALLLAITIIGIRWPSRTSSSSHSPCGPLDARSFPSRSLGCRESP